MHAPISSRCREQCVLIYFQKSFLGGAEDEKKDKSLNTEVSDAPEQSNVINLMKINFTHRRLTHLLVLISVVQMLLLQGSRRSLME